MLLVAQSDARPQTLCCSAQAQMLFPALRVILWSHVSIILLAPKVDTGVKVIGHLTGSQPPGQSVPGGS